MPPRKSNKRSAIVESDVTVAPAPTKKARGAKAVAPPKVATKAAPKAKDIAAKAAPKVAPSKATVEKNPEVCTLGLKGSL